MVKGLRCSMAILSVAIVFIAYLAFAQSYKTLQPSVQIATCSRTLKVYLVTSISSYYVYTYKEDLTQLNFGLTPPGGKLFYTLVLANFQNITIYSITWFSTLNQTTEYIVDKMEAYGPGRLYSTTATNYVFYFSYLTQKQWPITLGPNECVLIKYYIEIAKNCPVNVVYSWNVFFNSV